MYFSVVEQRFLTKSPFSFESAIARKFTSSLVKYLTFSESIKSNSKLEARVLIVMSLSYFILSIKHNKLK